ncbi:hypothetical protein HID58_086701, partial [Brassica napus]
MDQHIDPINNCVSREFKEGVDVFIAFVSNQNSFLEGKTMLCPCSKCQNRKQRDARTVSRHLYRVGFKSNYYLSSSHGENYYDVGGSSAGVRRTSASDWWACMKVVPRGVRETSEVVLTALQDDTHNQVVAQSEMLLIESYIMIQRRLFLPIDEYISEDELEESCTDSDSESDSNVRYVRPQLRTASMPAVTTPAPAPAQPIGPSSSGSAAPPAAPPTYVRRTEDALLCAPSRINQPHLHPDKPNGALWFGVDPEVHAFIRATWQGDYWGLWQSWIKVPEPKRIGWWHSFIVSDPEPSPFLFLTTILITSLLFHQQYYWEDSLHEEIHFKWKLQTQVSICGRISQKRKKNKQPKYIILANWSTDEAKAKSQSAADYRTSAPVGLKMHVHGAGPRCFVNIGYHMMIDQGLDALPSFTDLARKTHTRKDGTFMDERTEQLVLEVEQAVEEMLEDGSPVGDSQTCSTAATENSKRLLLNQEYIKRGKTRKGTIYGLGSVQFNNKHPSESVPASLNRNIGLETMVCGLETITQEIKSDFQTLKSDVQAIKTDFNQGMAKTQSSLDTILQFLQPQASNHTASTAQPTQSQAPRQGQAPPQGQAPSPARDMSPAQGESQPQHITSNNSELDRWCNT